MFANINAWIFDLDDTLYPPEQGLLRLVQGRINAFMIDAVNLPADEAFVLQKQFLNEHGTTLAGLMANYSVDPARFLHEVHDVPMDSVEPNPALKAQIAALPGRKFVLTNGAREYAGRVLKRLGFTDLFDGMWAIEDMDLVPKPAPATFRRFLQTFNIDPHRAAFFEDTPRNLVPAKALGMATVLIGDGRGHPVGDWVDVQARTLPDFLSTLPVLETPHDRSR